MPAVLLTWTAVHAAGSTLERKPPPYQIAFRDGRVSLRIDDGLLVEVMKELGRLAEFELIADPDDSVRVTANFEGVTLSEAIRRLCKSTGYVEVPNRETGKIERLVLTPSKAGPVARVEERREPLSPRPSMPEPPIEPDPVEPTPEEIEAAAREEQRHKEAEAQEQQRQQEQQEQQEQQPLQPAEPQIFPPPFGGDDDDDERRRKNDDDD